MNKPGRNDPCPCGSGKKYKKCCANIPQPTSDIGQDLFSHAVSLFQTGRLIEAQQACESVVSAEPKNADAFHLLGLVKHQNGLSDEAEKAFEQAIKLNSKEPSYLCNAGIVYLKNKKFDLAKGAFEKAIQIAPDYISALNNLGLLYKELEDYENALEIFKKIIKIEENDPDVLNNIGIIYAATNDDEQAKKYFEDVVKRFPDYAGVYINLADLENRNDNKDVALIFYQKALELEPNSAQACKHIADYYVELKEFEKSGEYYVQALENDPNYIEAVKAYLAWFLRQEDWKSIDFYLNKILPQFPDDAYLHYINAEFYMKEQMMQEAISEAKLTLNLDPSGMQGYIVLAKVYQDFDMIDEARGILQQGLENKIGQATIYHQLAQLEQKNHNYDEAERLSKQALKLEPALLESTGLFLAVNKVSRGDFESAAKKLEEIKSDPNELSEFNRDVFFAKGKVFDKLGKYDDAFNCYVKAVDMRRKLRNSCFDVEKSQRKVESKINSCSSHRLRNIPTCHQNTDQEVRPTPIFVVGFPRSGTTLLEQILCSHPSVSAGGEMTYISYIERKIVQDRDDGLNTLEYLSGLDDETANTVLCKWRSFYLDEVEKRGITNNDTMLFTDKMPLNVNNLPLISMLFPEAPIIRSVRNPMDVCLSAMFSNFTRGHDWANNIDDAAHFHKQTTKLIEHYKQYLNMNYFELRYEDLVADQEYWSRKVIDFVGLQWDEQCLQFHKTKRIARTASNEQVNKKMYKTSVARYKNYEKHLSGPLKTLEPIMRQYGYL